VGRNSNQHKKVKASNNKEEGNQRSATRNAAAGDQGDVLGNPVFGREQKAREQSGKRFFRSRN